MKIVFVSTFYEKFYGGAEVNTSLFFNKLKEKKIDVNIFTPNSLFFVPKKVFVLGNFLLDKVYAGLLYRSFIYYRPNVIHVQDLFALPASVIVAHKMGVPIVVTVHDSLPREHNFFSFNVFMLRNKRYKGCLKRCDRIIAVSNYIKNNLVDFGIESENIEVAYNLLPEWETSEEKSQNDFEAIKFFAPGRLDVGKGFDVLIVAFNVVQKKLPHAKLKIVGDGPEKEKLQKLTKILGLEENVSFIEKMSYKDICKHYLQADIVVFPSLYQEALGRIALEAAVAEKPIVASRVGGIPEIVVDGKSGFLVAPGDYNEMSEKMLELASSETLRKDMGSFAKDFVSSKFDQDVITEEVLKLYRNIIRGISTPKVSQMTNTESRYD